MHPLPLTSCTGQRTPLRMQRDGIRRGGLAVSGFILMFLWHVERSPSIRWPRRRDVRAGSNWPNTSSAGSPDRLPSRASRRSRPRHSGRGTCRARFGSAMASRCSKPTPKRHNSAPPSSATRIRRPHAVSGTPLPLSVDHPRCITPLGKSGMRHRDLRVHARATPGVLDVAGTAVAGSRYTGPFSSDGE
jgi:hypothetical protein